MFHCRMEEEGNANGLLMELKGLLLENILRTKRILDITLAVIVGRYLGLESSYYWSLVIFGSLFSQGQSKVYSVFPMAYFHL